MDRNERRTKKGKWSEVTCMGKAKKERRERGKKGSEREERERKGVDRN